jgi:hypothetical protein
LAPQLLYLFAGNGEGKEVMEIDGIAWKILRWETE